MISFFGCARGHIRDNSVILPRVDIGRGHGKAKNPVTVEGEKAEVIQRQFVAIRRPKGPDTAWDDWSREEKRRQWKINAKSNRGAQQDPEKVRDVIPLFDRPLSLPKPQGWSQFMRGKSEPLPFKTETPENIAVEAKAGKSKRDIRQIRDCKITTEKRMLRDKLERNITHGGPCWREALQHADLLPVKSTHAPPGLEGAMPFPSSFEF